MRARAKTVKNSQSAGPDPKAALEWIDRCVRAIELAINIDEDYAGHKTELLSAVEAAQDAGCDSEEIKKMRRGF